MNIVVLAKQVPEIALIKVDEAANEVVLPQGPGVVNPFDEYAVEEALRIKEKLGGKTMVMSVGSERTESALRNCLALGVDEAYLLVDEAFNGLGVEHVDIRLAIEPGRRLRRFQIRHSRPFHH